MNKKSYSLSNFDIFNLLDRRCNVMTYEELTKYKTIDQALGVYSALVLLYETHDHYGHWTLVFKYDNGHIIEVFDSYGIFPDDELKFVPTYFKKKKNEDYPYLIKLLYESGYKIVYNDDKLQEEKKGVNTCGRHVIARLMYRDIDIDDYVRMIKNSGMKPDDFVLNITNNI